MGSDASINKPSLPPTHTKANNTTHENAKSRSKYSSYLKDAKNKSGKAKLEGAIFQVMAKSNTKKSTGTSVKGTEVSEFRDSIDNKNSRLNTSINSQGSYYEVGKKISENRRNRNDFPRASTKSIDTRKSVDTTKNNLSQSQVSNRSDRKSIDNENLYYKQNFKDSQKSIKSREGKGYGDIYKSKKVYKESSQRSNSIIYD